jgi:hypothetical protein
MYFFKFLEENYSFRTKIFENGSFNVSDIPGEINQNKEENNNPSRNLKCTLINC